MSTRLWMYATLRNLRTNMNKTCQESMFIRYPTISKIREGAQLQDDIPKENNHGNMAEMTATHQRREVKANQQYKLLSLWIQSYWKTVLGKNKALQPL